jgi:hypothetical protein
MEIEQPAYPTADIFRTYIETVRFPAITVNRQLPSLGNKPAIVLRDSCTSRCSEDLLIEFTRDGALF